MCRQANYLIRNGDSLRPFESNQVSTWEVNHLGTFVNDPLTREVAKHYLHLSPDLLPAWTWAGGLPGGAVASFVTGGKQTYLLHKVA